MLIRGAKRLIVFLGPLLIVLFLFLRLHDKGSTDSSSPSSHWMERFFPFDTFGHNSGSSQEPVSITKSCDEFGASEVDIISNSAGREKSASEQKAQASGQIQALLEPFVPSDVEESHLVVYSASTANKAYFQIQFGDLGALNPNIIPHPSLKDTWIIVAQQQKSSVENSVWCVELVCNAVFKDDGTLGCVNAPSILPIAATSGDKCEGDLGYIALNVGPHDARVFYGPTTPYAIYGSNSAYACFGQWMLDFRLLVDWGYEPFSPEEFRQATELQRPAPYGKFEKNWFVFWDNHGQIHLHHDVAPKRVFAKLEYDGSIGADLAPLTAASDDTCLAKYMPKLASELESIHQATNSLAITLCRRSDPSCEANDANTFILTIFQHKSYYMYHATYEPYVMLFRQTAPFEVHGISRKPIWVYGRTRPAAESPDSQTAEEGSQPWPKTSMFYITSLSWKAQDQRYHGHIDDVMFIAFGIEDSMTAGIDVVAGDLLADIGLCFDP